MVALSILWYSAHSYRKNLYTITVAVGGTYVSKEDPECLLILLAQGYKTFFRDFRK